MLKFKCVYIYIYIHVPYTYVHCTYIYVRADGVIIFGQEMIRHDTPPPRDICSICSKSLNLFVQIARVYPSSHLQIGIGADHSPLS